MTTTPSIDRSTLRPVAVVVGGGRHHWVGDGFRVEQMFGPGDQMASLVSPFLLLDYHAPYEYGPTETPRGVGVHPHRGFETVTLAFDGSVAHHDSSGAGGVIRPWRRAMDDRCLWHPAQGVPRRRLGRCRGQLHMVQLWVNLPAANKMDPPHYQPLTAEQIGPRRPRRTRGFSPRRRR